MRNSLFCKIFHNLSGDGKMTKKHKNNNRDNNVITLQYIKPHFNIGVIFLVLIFIYLCISIFMFLTKKKINIYEVNTGSLVSDNTFKGVIIYDEELVLSDKAGYINYYISDADKAGVNTVICSVDEVGTVSKQLQAMEESTGSLSSQTVKNISVQLLNHSKNFSASEFYQTYNVLDNISTIISQYKSSYLINELKKLVNENSFVNLYAPRDSVTVSFYTDSLFGLDENMISAETFNQEHYKLNYLKKRELIGVNDVLYRRLNSDSYKIVFPLTANQVAQYSGNDSLTIKFKDSPIKAKASLKIINNPDGSYGVLMLDKYLINFLDKRFIDFELSVNSVSGLKIPISSICEKEFFTIPEEYAMSSDDSSKNTGFLLLTYDENGNKSRKFVEATYYAREDGYLYVSKDVFSNGDCIVMPPKDDEPTFKDEIYIVGTLGSLKGAYCINKGYCQFRRVKILEKNDEYYIVERGTLYGLSIYDHIILNADYVSENQIIY